MFTCRNVRNIAQSIKCTTRVLADAPVPLMSAGPVQTIRSVRSPNLPIIDKFRQKNNTYYGLITADGLPKLCSGVF